MRKKLKSFENLTENFTAVFSRFGERTISYKKRLISKQTILLTDIKHIKGDFVADHVWLNFTSDFQNLDLQKDDIVFLMPRLRNTIKFLLDIKP